MDFAASGVHLLQVVVVRARIAEGAVLTIAVPAAILYAADSQELASEMTGANG
jgi:hypothetical protein